MTAKGFGLIKPRQFKKGEKVRTDVCQKVYKEISKQLHPNGEPKNMKTASWIDENGSWFIADITNHPELWHLAGFNDYSKKKWNINPNNPRNEN